MASESSKIPAINIVSVGLLLTAVLVVLKVVGMSSLSWFWSLFPAILAVAIGVVALVIFLGILGLFALAAYLAME